VVSKDRAFEILNLTELRKEKIVSYELSGKIRRKNVKDGRVSFMVGDEWISAFTIGKGVTEELKEGLRDLMEGDSAEFQIQDNQGKDGRVYKNIVGATKVQQLREDAASVPPAGQSGQEKKAGESDSRIRSMCVAYVKDLIVADKVDISDWQPWAESFEKYILGL
jgi:hypothetical protein